MTDRQLLDLHRMLTEREAELAEAQERIRDLERRLAIAKAALAGEALRAAA